MPIPTVVVTMGDKRYVAWYETYVPGRKYACALGETKSEATGRLLRANGELLALVDGKIVLRTSPTPSPVTVTARGMLSSEKKYEEFRL